LIDQRRAILAQAKLFNQQSVAERRLLVNDLLMDASMDYWNWARDYHILLVLDTAIRLNKERYTLVSQSYEQGDRAAMDTAEALAQLQSFEQLREEALLNYQKSSLALSNFVWMANGQPLYLKATTIPDASWLIQSALAPNLTALDEWLNNMLTQHPKLAVIDYKIQSLKVDRQLKFQSLLPKADVKYNFLQQGYEAWRGWGGALLENNYRFGFEIAIPLPNRSGIGNYRAARIKIKSTELERDLVRLQLENKLRYHYGEVLNLSKQVDIFSKAYQNYVLLLNAEKLKFTLGETTLFILNARENKALETQQKLLSIKAKYLQALTQLSWAGGQLQ
jgi:outer membrane protein TolC